MLKKGFWLILLSLLFRSIAGVLTKQAGMETSGKAITSILINPFYLTALIFFLLQALSWSFVLKKFSLGFAYPFMSLGIVINLLAAAFLFNEELYLTNLVGALIIVLGVIKISTSETKSINDFG